ncbi:hypothetical protein ABZ883_04685 [Streptomyces sp. NPDC046977]|uniref:hypothetical protein n=1 Tax=Streptomyces sp. NPDC046977 TaxID=3154703 RepID=UPI0033CF9FA4
MRSARFLTTALLALTAACTTVHAHDPAPVAHGRITALDHLLERSHTVRVDRPMTLCSTDRTTGKRKCKPVSTGQFTTRKVIDQRECWQVTLSTGHRICTTSARWYGARIGARW